MTTPNARGLLIGSVVGVGVLIVLGVLTAGPVQVEGPRWSPPAVTPTPLQLPGASPGSRLPQTVAADPLLERIVGIILEVLFAVAVAAVVAVIVVVIVRRIRERRRLLRRREVLGEVGGGVASASDGSVPAPVMRRGIARALQILDERRAPSDAVIEAWLGLEEAAADAGAGRNPAETPAEYTARIVQRFDTDTAAAQSLLRLYQDVRFGGRTADAATVAAARDSLLRLQSSWHEVPEASR